MKHRLLFVVFICSFGGAFAQPADRHVSREEYIEQWKNEAIDHMLRYRIPASITLAQGILESANGNSALALYANNHFGIKCHGWGGKGYYIDDDEEHECFRRYFSAEESFTDHAEFLKGRERYRFLFDYATTDYKSWAKGLKKAGYATNPRYPDLLISLIERYDLQQYDKVIPLVEANAPKEVETAGQEVELKAGQRKVLIHANTRKYIVLREGDTFTSLSEELDMGKWQLLKYNDLRKRDKLKPGEVLFLQPKRNRAKVVQHTAKEGETLWMISQHYGIKLKKLIKKNPFSRNEPLSQGTQVNLR